MICNGVAGEVCRFVMVTVWYVLVVPTGDEKLVMRPGNTVTGAFPVPLKGTVCGLPVASSTTLRNAVLVPDAVGLKVTTSWQLVAGGMGDGTVGQLLVNEKSSGFAPVTLIAEIFSGTLCVFVSITFFVVLGRPTKVAGNVKEVGANTTGCTAVPVSEIELGLPGAL